MTTSRADRANCALAASRLHPRRRRRRPHDHPAHDANRIGALVSVHRRRGSACRSSRRWRSALPVVASDLPGSGPGPMTRSLYAPPTRPLDWLEPIATAVTSDPVRRRSGQEFAKRYRWAPGAHEMLRFLGVPRSAEDARSRAASSAVDVQSSATAAATIPPRRRSGNANGLAPAVSKQSARTPLCASRRRRRGERGSSKRGTSPATTRR